MVIIRLRYGRYSRVSVSSPGLQSPCNQPRPAGWADSRSQRSAAAGCTFVLEGGAAQNRHEMQGQRALAQQASRRVATSGSLPSRYSIIASSSCFDGQLRPSCQRHSSAACLKFRLRTEWRALTQLAPRSSPCHSPFFHGDKINQCLHSSGPRPRSEYRIRNGASAPVRSFTMRISDTVEEIRADLVHLVDEHHARHFVPVGPDATQFRFCGSTPALASRTQTAPSRTARLNAQPRS